MKTPWDTLYHAGEKLDDWLEAKGLPMGSSMMVGFFYFLAVFVLIGVVAAGLHLASAGSDLDAYAQTHFEEIFLITLGVFVAYAARRTIPSWFHFATSTNALATIGAA
jgi:hypothetical protein